MGLWFVCIMWRMYKQLIWPVKIYFYPEEWGKICHSDLSKGLAACTVASVVEPQPTLAVVHVSTCENDKKEEKYLK